MKETEIDGIGDLKSSRSAHDDDYDNAHDDDINFVDDDNAHGGDDDDDIRY